MSARWQIPRRSGDHPPACPDRRKGSRCRPEAWPAGPPGWVWCPDAGRRHRHARPRRSGCPPEVGPDVSPGPTRMYRLGRPRCPAAATRCLIANLVT